MSPLRAIILGIIEGSTEFIPVSSSGHLIIARQILGANDLGGLSFDAILQLSSTLALVVYFWGDLMRLVNVSWGMVSRKNISNKDKVLLYSIVLGTIPAVIFGLIFEKQMETVFRNVKLVSLTLILGSFLLWISQKISQEFFEKKAGKFKSLDIFRGIIVGFFQCLALVPGISRSGATISGGLLSGLSKEEAVRFSFLLSVPILLGSGLKKLFEVRGDLFTSEFGLSLFLGGISAFLVSLISIRFLIKYLKSHNLDVFIWYRIILAILLLFTFI